MPSISENIRSIDGEKVLKPKTGLEGFYTTEIQKTLRSHPESFVSILKSDSTAYKTIAEIIGEDKAKNLQLQNPPTNEKNPDSYSDDPTTAQIQKAIYDQLGISVETDSNGLLKKLMKGCIDWLVVWNIKLIEQIKKRGLAAFLSEVVSQFSTTEGWKKLFAKIGDDIGHILSWDPYKTGKTGSEYVGMIGWAGLAGWALKKWWKSLGEVGAKVAATNTVWETLGSKIIHNTARGMEWLWKWTVKAGEVLQVPYKVIDKATGATIDGIWKWLRVGVESVVNIPSVQKITTAVKGNVARIVAWESARVVAAREAPISLKYQIGAVGDDVSKVKPFEKWEWKLSGEEPKISEVRPEKKELGFDIAKNEVYSKWQYANLKEHAEFLWELKEGDILGHWMNATVVRHPTREGYVVKIPKRWWDDVVKETMKHNKAYITLRQWKKEWMISENIEIPEIQLSTEQKSWYFLVQKVEGQSLHTRFLREHPDLQVVFKDIPKDTLNKMTDEQVWRVSMDYGKRSEFWVNKMYNLIDLESSTFTKEFLQKNYPEYRKALQYLEEKGIQHNDLHGWNFMVWNDNKLYLIDFGKASIK